MTRHIEIRVTFDEGYDPGLYSEILRILIWLDEREKLSLVQGIRKTKYSWGVIIEFKYSLNVTIYVAHNNTVLYRLHGISYSGSPYSFERVTYLLQTYLGPEF